MVDMADYLQIAQCEGPMDMDAVKLALQCYNYGQGYITWAMNKYDEYTKANAFEFSSRMAEQYGWNSYVDMDYVPHVLRYYPLWQIFYDSDTSSLIVEVARTLLELIRIYKARSLARLFRKLVRQSVWLY